MNLFLLISTSVAMKRKSIIILLIIDTSPDLLVRIFPVQSFLRKLGNHVWKHQGEKTALIMIGAHDDVHLQCARGYGTYTGVDGYCVSDVSIWTGKYWF